MIEISDKQEKKEKKKSEAFKSIKVKESTYDELQSMGQGISKAVEILVSAKKESVGAKIDDISEISAELADIMFASGVFDIKFKGSGIENVEMDDDSVTIHGFIAVGIADRDAREEVYRVLSDGLERKA